MNERKPFQELPICNTSYQENLKCLKNNGYVNDDIPAKDSSVHKLTKKKHSTLTINKTNPEKIKTPLISNSILTNEVYSNKKSNHVDKEIYINHQTNLSVEKKNDNNLNDLKNTTPIISEIENFKHRDSLLLSGASNNKSVYSNYSSDSDNNTVSLAAFQDILSSNESDEELNNMDYLNQNDVLETNEISRRNTASPSFLQKILVSDDEENTIIEKVEEQRKNNIHEVSKKIDAQIFESPSSQPQNKNSSSVNVIDEDLEPSPVAKRTRSAKKKKKMFILRIIK